MHKKFHTSIVFLFLLVNYVSAQWFSANDTLKFFTVDREYLEVNGPFTWYGDSKNGFINGAGILSFIKDSTIIERSYRAVDGALDSTDLEQMTNRPSPEQGIDSNLVEERIYEAKSTLSLDKIYNSYIKLNLKQTSKYDTSIVENVVGTWVTVNDSLTFYSKASHFQHVDENATFTWNGGNYKDVIHGTGTIFKWENGEIVDSFHGTAFLGAMDLTDVYRMGKSLYIGNILKYSMNGFGVFIDSSCVYVGSIVNNIPEDPHDTSKWECFEGHGKIHGLAHKRYSDGTFVDAVFSKGKINGFFSEYDSTGSYLTRGYEIGGKIYFSKESRVIDSTTKKNVVVKYGKLPDTTYVYEGLLSGIYPKNNPHSGLFSEENLNRMVSYTGFLKNGKLETGKGALYIYESGQSYEGDFCKGMICSKNKVTIEGDDFEYYGTLDSNMFKNGIYRGPLIRIADMDSTDEEYIIGDFSYDDLSEFADYNNIDYEGSFKHHPDAKSYEYFPKMHDTYGILHFNDSVYYKGFFENGRMHGRGSLHIGSLLIEDFNFGELTATWEEVDISTLSEDEMDNAIEADEADFVDDGVGGLTSLISFTDVLTFFISGAGYIGVAVKLIKIGHKYYKLEKIGKAMKAASKIANGSKKIQKGQKFARKIEKVGKSKNKLEQKARPKVPKRPPIKYDKEDSDPINYEETYGSKNDIIKDFSADSRDKMPRSRSYTSNGFYYKTNRNGSITNFAGRLRKDSNNRKPSIQRKIGNMYNCPTMKGNGGHLFADIFGGSGSHENVVPFSSNLNHREYRRLESKLQKALKKGNSVFMKGRLKYDRGRKYVPSLIYVDYWIDGKWETVNPPFNNRCAI